MRDSNASFDQRLQLNYLRTIWSQFLENHNIVASIDTETGGLCLTVACDDDETSLVTLRQDLPDYEDVD